MKNPNEAGTGFIIGGGALGINRAESAVRDPYLDHLRCRKRQKVTSRFMPIRKAFENIAPARERKVRFFKQVRAIEMAVRVSAPPVRRLQLRLPLR
jgi:hypothetical protein